MCVPCQQTIIWNDRLAGMLASVNTLLTVGVAGGKNAPSPQWARRWYETVEKACGSMQPLLDELVASERGAGPESGRS